MELKYSSGTTNPIDLAVGLGEETIVVPRINSYVTDPTNLAIMLECKEDEDGFIEPYGSLTVNLGNDIGNGEPMPVNCAFIDVNNLRGATKFIEENKLGAQCYIDGNPVYKQSGYVTYPLYEFFPEKLLEMDLKGYEAYLFQYRNNQALEEEDQFDNQEAEIKMAFEVLELEDFKLHFDGEHFSLVDTTGENPGNIENESFADLNEVLFRLEKYHQDYFYENDNMHNPDYCEHRDFLNELPLASLNMANMKEHWGLIQACLVNDINSSVKENFIEAAEKEIQEELRNDFQARDAVLDLCHSIDGYLELDNKVQQNIYDALQPIVYKSMSQDAVIAALKQENKLLNTFVEEQKEEISVLEKNLSLAEKSDFELDYSREDFESWSSRSEVEAWNDRLDAELAYENERYW